VDLIVGSDGLTRDVKIDRGVTPALDKAAVDTVRKWKFTPATKDGRPVAVQIKVEVSFKLY
jgi:protein TonB